MSNADLAKKIREAIYERSDDEGGAISREQMDDAIERALNAENKRANPYTSGVYVGTDGVRYEILDFVRDMVLINGVSVYRTFIE